MILPPVISTNTYQVKEALENYLGIECIKHIEIEECGAYITFRTVDATPKLKAFVKELSGEVVFAYEEKIYTIVSQYFDL
jgi:hypothetical protein